jgi:chromosome segregation ATPase
MNEQLSEAFRMLGDYKRVCDEYRALLDKAFDEIERLKVERDELRDTLAAVRGPLS